MALTIVTEPTIEPLDLDELEDHLRLSETSTGEEDILLTFYLTAARRYWEKVQGRAYLHQTWNLILDDFPSGSTIKLARPPLVSVTHLKHYGTGGTATTMTAGNYYVDTDSEPGRLCLAYGESWPTATLRPNNGVEIQFLAGYGSAASSVPSEIKEALKLAVGHLYERREADDILKVTPDWVAQSFMAVDSLMGIDRIWQV